MYYWLDFVHAIQQFLPIIAIQLIAVMTCFIFLANAPNFLQRQSSYLYLTGASVVIFVCWCVIFFQYTVDDVYIFLRYARNFGNGYGLTFNIGSETPVEGYTSFLWTLLLSIPYALKLADPVPLQAAKIVGIIFGAGSVILSGHLLLKITANRLAGALAALFVALLPFLGFWSVGGLETSLYVFLVLLTLVIYVQEHNSGKRPVLSVIVLFTAILARPDAIVLAIGLYGQDLIGKKTLKAAIGYMLRGGVILIALLIGYTLWRYSTYGYILPNTFYAKQTPLTPAAFVKRIYELFPYYQWVFPIAVVAALRLWIGIRNHHNIQLLIGPALAAAVLPLLAYREWMPGFRYEIVFSVLIFIIAADGVRLILEHYNMNLVFEKILLIALLTTGYAYLFLPSESLIYERNRVSEHTILSMGSSGTHHPALGIWIKNNAPPNASVAAWDMGAIPYFSELPVASDIHSEGLLSAYTTHQGYSPQYFFDQKPTFLLLPAPSDKQTTRLQAFYAIPDFCEYYQFAFMTTRPEHIYVLKSQISLTPTMLEEAKTLLGEAFVDLSPADSSSRPFCDPEVIP